MSEAEEQNTEVEESDDTGNYPMSRCELLSMLAQSIRHIHGKINGGRISKKDKIKLEFLKVQSTLTTTYLAGAKELEAELAAENERINSEQIRNMITLMRDPKMRQLLKDNPDFFETCGGVDPDEAEEITAGS